MAEPEERITGAIEAVGFNKWQDPEMVVELQAAQRMYERIADEIRERKNIPFPEVMKRAQDKAEAAERENPENEAGESQ